MPTRRLSRLVAASLLLAVAASSCASTFTAGVALVDGTRITREELADAVQARLQGQPAPEGEQRIALERDALSEMISLVLTRRIARERKVTVTDERVTRELADVRARFPSEEEFLARVKEAGFTLETLTARFRDELIREALTVALAPRPDAKVVAARYKAQIDQYRQVMVRHILFTVDQATPEAAAKRKADAVLARIRAGGDFAALARTESQDTSSAPQGGSLPGWTSLAGLDQAFAKAAFGAPLNRAVGPVRSQFGYHLILTTAKRTRPLRDVFEEIVAALAAEDGQAALAEAVRAVGSRARIEVNPRYGDWDPDTGTVAPHSSYIPAAPQEIPPGLPDGLAPGGPPGAPPGS